MSRILIPSRRARNWRRFLADPKKQWKWGYSARATAHCWESSDGLPDEIATLLGPETELLLAIPEHKVALPGGRRESQCDVFALVRRAGGTCAVAVEAKVNEPFGDTVGTWLKDASAGKMERLSFICERLGVACPPDPTLRYQLFHRTVAAIVEAERFGAESAAMVVQSFAQDYRWFDDFAAFGACFGASLVPGQAAEVRLPSGMPLILGWATGAPAFLSRSGVASFRRGRG